MAVIERDREQSCQPDVESLPVADSSFIGIPTAGLGGDLGRVQVAPALGNNINDCDEGSGTVDRGTRTSDNLDPLNQVQLHGKVCADQGAIVDVVLHAVPIKQEKNPGVVVTRPC